MTKNMKILFLFASCLLLQDAFAESDTKSYGVRQRLSQNHAKGKMTLKKTITFSDKCKKVSDVLQEASQSGLEFVENDYDDITDSYDVSKYSGKFKEIAESLAPESFADLEPNFIIKQNTSQNSGTVSMEGTIVLRCAKNGRIPGILKIHQEATQNSGAGRANLTLNVIVHCKEYCDQLPILIDQNSSQCGGTVNKNVVLYYHCPAAAEANNNKFPRFTVKRRTSQNNGNGSVSVRAFVYYTDKMKDVNDDTC